MDDNKEQLTLFELDKTSLEKSKENAKEQVAIDDVSALYKKNRKKFLKSQARRKEIAKNEFKVFTKEREFLSYVEIYILSNFPKAELSLKNHLSDKVYNLIDNTCLANNNKGNIRIKYQRNMLADISSIDFFLKECLEKYLIKRRKFNTSINYLSEIKSMTYSWIDSEQESMNKEKQKENK